MVVPVSWQLEVFPLTFSLIAHRHATPLWTTALLQVVAFHLPGVEKLLLPAFLYLEQVLVQVEWDDPKD